MVVSFDHWLLLTSPLESLNFTRTQEQERGVIYNKSYHIDVSVVHLFQGFEYSRSGNPTRNCLEKSLAASEGAKHGETVSLDCGK